MKNAHKQMVASRTAMIFDHPFFGALGLRLKLVEDEQCKTAWTDGVSIGFNPAYVAGLTPAKRITLVAHEVLHCAHGHPFRRGGRDHDQWNVACDYAINSILVEAGFEPLEGWLYDVQYTGKSAEWIYDRLPTPDSQSGQGAGNGTQQAGGGDSPQHQRDPNGAGAGNDPTTQRPAGQPVPGEVRDAPTDAGVTEADWRQAVQQAAAAARARGKMPGQVDRVVAAAARSRVDWRSVLHRFVQSVARTDYSWRRPNARHAVRGLYLPALRSDELGPLMVAIDTSGSVDGVLIGQFEAELRSIVDEMQPERVHVAWCDARLHRVDVFERGDPIELRPVGGGGTDFRPVFSAVEQLEEPPVALVYLTDLAGRFPTAEPDYPVLWATVADRPAPFGEKVIIE